jgi:hypothetical protein
MSRKSVMRWSGILPFALFILVALFLASCGSESDLVDFKDGDCSTPKNADALMKEHVAFFDARVRSISETAYVREIVLINFSSDLNMPSSFIFCGTTFFDDGSYNDLAANDGIYASAAEFEHNAEIPYDARYEVRSVMQQMVVAPDFLHDEELDALASRYHVPSATGAEFSPAVFRFEVHCDIEFGTCGCRADRWGLCNCCCFTISNCREITVVFGI